MNVSEMQYALARLRNFIDSIQDELSEDICSTTIY